MSLLLEALKKAEKAKEEAQRRAKGGDTPEAAADPDATLAAAGRHVMTRDELPDISAPLEILSEDIRPAAPKRSAPLELSLADPLPAAAPASAPAPEPKASPRREPARAAGKETAKETGKETAGNANSERAAAQRVFEAKFKEPNPRLPFYIAMGLLGTFAVGTGIYFWLQLRPAPSLVNANPPKPSGEQQVAAGTPPAAPTAASAPAAAAGAIPGLPGSPPAPDPAATPTVPAPATPAAAAPASTPGSAPTPASTATPAPAAAAPGASAPAKPAPRAAETPRARSASAPRGDERGLSIRRPGPQIHPQVVSGYAAYQAGNLAVARDDYQQALREEATNRDALLGLAAVEMRAKRYDLADAYYARVLQMDPRDAHAQAGMLSLRSQQLDPVMVESRVKSMLAADREANVLYFTLGNQYAAQGRWAEAQQAYFKAFAIDPDNPDFAFNLAISLDQLRQPKLALEYYRRALALAEKRNANFAPDSARDRIQQLASQPASPQSR